MKRIVFDHKVLWQQIHKEVETAVLKMKREEAIIMKTHNTKKC
jgi:hypothetical protein